MTSQPTNDQPPLFHQHPSSPPLSSSTPSVQPFTLPKELNLRLKNGLCARNGSYWLPRDRCSGGKALQRDRYHGRRSAVTNKERNYWILRGGVLTTRTGPLQRKCDRCSRRWE
ncbi:hypothetical protein HAX54_013225, partial [Datura stramonium]|nr:hypothetical protein [Datura stramonium]